MQAKESVGILTALPESPAGPGLPCQLDNEHKIKKRLHTFHHFDGLGFEFI